MSETQIVAQPPAVPSKWEIIPIHGSDVASYKRCRRYWDWTSPSRNNLRRMVTIHGVKMELWFGTGIHFALEKYYDPILQHDPVESFKTWYDFQWKGGVVGEEWLDRTYDIHPQLVASDHVYSPDGQPHDEYEHTYKILGLRDLLPNPEVVEEEFEMHRDLGVGMMTFYKDWAVKNDDFVTVAAESVFSVPLGFDAVDLREASPNYGKSLEVHARGKRDAVLFWPEYDKFGINDHKTAAKVDEDYFVKLEKDEQITQYLWATIREAALYDLPWKGGVIDRALYTALRKNYPKAPLMTTHGVPSLDKTKQSCTADMFQQTIADDPVLGEWFVKNEKAQMFYTYLCEQGDAAFVMRDTVYRNKQEIDNFEKHLIMTAKEMVDPKLNIYPNPSGHWLCTGCAFRAPCVAVDDGSDWVGMLADAYEQNRDR